MKAMAREETKQGHKAEPPETPCAVCKSFPAE